MSTEPTPDLSFEAALEQLETIVDDLEQGEPELASALAKYERAVRLLARCQHLIDGAEQTIALLTGVDDQGRPVTAPFDATATATDPREPSPPSPRKLPPGSANNSGLPDNDDSDPPF
jgi:exodeoxyribonuclease VII small subunit